MFSGEFEAEIVGIIEGVAKAAMIDILKVFDRRSSALREENEALRTSLVLMGRELRAVRRPNACHTNSTLDVSVELQVRGESDPMGKVSFLERERDPSQSASCLPALDGQAISLSAVKSEDDCPESFPITEDISGTLSSEWDGYPDGLSSHPDAYYSPHGVIVETEPLEEPGDDTVHCKRGLPRKNSTRHTDEFGQVRVWRSLRPVAPRVPASVLPSLDMLSAIPVQPTEEHLHSASDEPRVDSFTCTQCNKVFSTTEEFKRHLQTHQKTSPGRPFRCTLCGKSFTSKSNLTVHHITHTGEKPHRCSTCGKRFGLICNLRMHERIHSDVRPFLCTRCGKSFTQNHVLQKHACPFLKA
ncbi:zinc finger protein Gfi-1b-like [Clupea harengus]|uniref:Zinc finger protein Gfi-1b-like n=1 Tax=Clupea harengus TaxID=7950 RepID=A0A8M1KCE7_CLUHA|nr:zinc finger protein Gfi-1b-like [Clupea harengus]